MENRQKQNVSSTDTTPTMFNALSSNTQPTSTTARSVTNDKGTQHEALTLRKKNVDDRKKSQIWDHFTRLDGDPKSPKAECNYCKKTYACHTVMNGTSNMWSHLKVCKKFPFVVDKKQKLLV